MRTLVNVRMSGQKFYSHVYVFRLIMKCFFYRNAHASSRRRSHEGKEILLPHVGDLTRVNYITSNELKNGNRLNDHPKLMNDTWLNQFYCYSKRLCPDHFLIRCFIVYEGTENLVPINATWVSFINKVHVNTFPS